ncbi:MAG: VWA domain-containing protein [Acidobacteriota bacterium]
MKLWRSGRRRLPMVFFRAAGVCLMAAALVWGQEAETPIFRTGTRLVQVDVVVHSKKAPVAGLTKDDFEVFDNGKRQAIAVFSVREATAVRAAPVALPAGVVTNRPVYRGPEPVTATVVLMDSQNTTPEHQGRARLQALKYLDRAGRRELIALYQLGTTLKVLEPFTEDRDALRSAVDKFKMEQSFNLQDGQGGLLAGIRGNAANETRKMNFQRQADITTAAFETIARHLQGLPGRKKLIWITAGLPLDFQQENERNLTTMTEYTNLSKQIYAPMKLMNEANVAIYPIDPRGVMSPMEGAGLMDPNLNSMNQLAAMTGGKAFYNDNDLVAGLEEAIADTDLTYTLGFYQPEDVVDGTMHSLRVDVLRGGAEARYRKSYTAEGPGKPPAAKFLKATLAGWLRQPLESTEIQIRAAAVPSKNKLGYYDVVVVVDVAGLKLEEKKDRFAGSIEVAIVPDSNKTPKGLHQTIQVNLTQDRLRTALDTGIAVYNQVRVTNDKGKLLAKGLHLVVMDQATGKTGSVRIPLNGK